MKDRDSFQQLDGNRVRWQGRTLLYFAGCDYFRLARHPAVIKAASTGLQRLGLNVAASRLTTGHHRIYDELETQLAQYFRSRAALVLPTGYLTSAVVAQSLAGDFACVLIDDRAHPALQDAARHFECPVTTFRHRDPEDVLRVLRGIRRRGRVVLLTDGMFSLEGAVAPLRAYLECLPEDAMLLVDDAHGAGILGENGRGTPEHEGVGRGRLVQCVTLSKALGAYGGAVMGTPALRRRIMERSRAFMGCTALPPPLANAALCSVRLLRDQGGAMRRRLRRNAEQVKAALRVLGYKVPELPGPIILLHPPTDRETRQLKRRLLEDGIYPPLLRYAGAPTGCFRFVISSEHTAAQLDRLIRSLRRFKGAGISGGGKGSARARAGAGRR